MLKYFINGFFVLFFCVGWAQQQTSTDLKRDSISYEQPYGLRAGIDLSRPVLTFLDDDYTGFEVVADYRLSQNLYIAGELGNEKRTRVEELGNINNVDRFAIYDFTTSGSYIKLGIDVNTYENWYGMNNVIFFGGRYAFATFSQTLNSYRIYDSNRYWNPDAFIVGSQAPEEFKSLNASWLELVVGTKAELFKNLYAGISVRLGFLVSNKEADRFPNLWIPGFNRVTDNSNFGVGYNYSISYLLPLYRKPKKPKVEGSTSN